MSCVLLSQDANPILKSYLSKINYIPIEIKKTNLVYDAISSHADIYACKVNHELVIEPSQLKLIKKELESQNIKYKSGKNSLGFKYPHNINFNSYCTDKYIIHNFKYTDNSILETAKQQGLISINVSQGYTNCNIVEINNNSLITSDIGIKNTLNKYNFDVLLIEQGYVKLKGFKYGFLGGATGKIDNKVIFNGNLLDHPDHNKIINFIESKGLEVIYFKEFSLTDIGSIIRI